MNVITMLDCARLLEDHSEDCGALNNVGNGTWEHPWSPVPVETERGNARKPGKGSNKTWWVLQCLDTDCKARLGINADDMLEVITDD